MFLALPAASPTPALNWRQFKYAILFDNWGWGKAYQKKVQEGAPSPEINRAQRAKNEKSEARLQFMRSKWERRQWTESPGKRSPLGDGALGPWLLDRCMGRWIDKGLRVHTSLHFKMPEHAGVHRLKSPKKWHVQSKVSSPEDHKSPGHRSCCIGPNRDLQK